MILQGSTISSINHSRSMVQHLFKEDDNEQIIVKETIDGELNRESVKSSLYDMQLQTNLTGGKCGIFSVAISPRQEDEFSQEQYDRAIAMIEDKFGLQDQLRVRVDHLKDGRYHSHLLWSLTRYDEEKGKHLLIPVGRYKRSLQYCAQDMEKTFDLQPVNRKPNENTMEITNADRMVEARAKRRGQEVQLTLDRKNEVSSVWEKTQDGQSFINGLQKLGYGVAKGDKVTKRGNVLVLIDRQGNTFNLARELPKLVKAKHLRERVGGLQKDLLSVTDWKALNEAKNKPNVLEEKLDQKPLKERWSQLSVQTKEKLDKLSSNQRRNNANYKDQEPVEKGDKNIEENKEALESANDNQLNMIKSENVNEFTDATKIEEERKKEKFKEELRAERRRRSAQNDRSHDFDI